MKPAIWRRLISCVLCLACAWPAFAGNKEEYERVAAPLRSFVIGMPQRPMALVVYKYLWDSNPDPLQFERDFASAVLSDKSVQGVNATDFAILMQTTELPVFAWKLKTIERTCARHPEVTNLRDIREAIGIVREKLSEADKAKIKELEIVEFRALAMSALQDAAPGDSIDETVVPEPAAQAGEPPAPADAGPNPAPRKRRPRAPNSGGKTKTERHRKKIHDRIYDANGIVRPEMRELKGYQTYADLYLGGNMYGAYRVVRKVIGTPALRSLGWGKKFEGTTEEYNNVRQRVIGQDGRPIVGMTGPEGYQRYAHLYQNGDMLKAWMNVSIVLSREEFKALKWGKKVPGNIKKYKAINERLIGSDGHLIQDMTHPKGYVRYAETYHRDAHGNGDMLTAFVTVSAVLPEIMFENLKWGKEFPGTTKEYSEILGRLFLPNGQPIPSMEFPEGYVGYANTFNGGNMDRAYRQASAALTKENFESLKWGKVFHQSSKEYAAVRARLFGPDGKPIEAMTTRQGYVLYAETYHLLTPQNGDMTKTFVSVSAVLSDEEFQALGWGNEFQGTTQEYRQVRSRVIDPQGRPIKRMTEPKGYRNYANVYRGGDMFTAYVNVSAVLSKDEFESLGWGKAFQGTAALYLEYRAMCVFPDGIVNPAVKGEKGLSDLAWTLAKKLASTPHQQRHQYEKARRNLRAVVSEKEIRDLEWPKSVTPKPRM